MKCPILVDFPCCHVRNINVHEGFKYINDLSTWTDEIVLTGDYETLLDVITKIRMCYPAKFCLHFIAFQLKHQFWKELQANEQFPKAIIRRLKTKLSKVTYILVKRSDFKVLKNNIIRMCTWAEIFQLFCREREKSCSNLRIGMKKIY